MSEPAADALSVRDAIADEMMARGWTSEDVAIRMPGDAAVNKCVVDVLLVIDRPDCALGITADRLAVAFGVQPEFFLSIERQYRAARGWPPAPPRATTPGDTP